MRKTAFIIAEYDPFHNGHLYHILKTREAGAERIVCILSGYFVQRGKPAFFGKRERTQMALQGGADLVLELPTRYVLGGAENFARGAMEIIRAAGIPGTVSFGAAAPLEVLQPLSVRMRQTEVRDRIRARAKQTGESYAAAVSAVLSESDEAAAMILKDPNNILALEYMNAAANYDADVDFFALKRFGAAHNAEQPENGFASAGFVRKVLRLQSKAPRTPYVPPFTEAVIRRAFAEGRAPVLTEKYELAVMSALLRYTPESLAEIEGISAGLEHRILRALRECSTLDHLLDEVKTKRYTHARLRRCLCAAALGVTKEGAAMPPAYLRVLGFRGDAGRALLREMRDTAAVPAIVNLSAAPACEEKELEIRAGKLYEMLLPQPRERNPEIADGAVMLP